MFYQANHTIVLHPQHKLKYFKHAGWESEWIDTAEALVHEKFAQSYSIQDAAADVTTVNESAATPALSQGSNIFDDLLSLAPPKTTDLRSELDHYLSTDVENVTDAGALQWWNERRQAYPHLSRMGLDYLAIPGEFFVLWWT